MRTFAELVEVTAMIILRRKRFLGDQSVKARKLLYRLGVWRPPRQLNRSTTMHRAQSDQKPALQCFADVSHKELPRVSKIDSIETAPVEAASE